MITKKEFSKLFMKAFNDDSESSVIDIGTAGFIVDTMADVLKNVIVDMEVGDSFNYRGFGTFRKKSRNINTDNLYGRNSVNGVFSVITFSPCQSIKDMMRYKDVRQ